MPDQAEIATDYAERHHAEALANHRARQAPPRESADNCAECGDQISSERQIAAPGCDMCTDCATWWEHVAERRRMGLA